MDSRNVAPKYQLSDSIFQSLISSPERYNEIMRKQTRVTVIREAAEAGILGLDGDKILFVYREGIKFRVRRETGKKRDMWWQKTSEAPATLWNIDAVSGASVVYITEGESDALELRSSILELDRHPNDVVAVVALPNAGAARYLPGEIFSDREVFLVGDNDDAGKKSRRTLIKQIRDSADSIYTIEWPANLGKDFSDLKDGGADVEEIFRTCTRAVSIAPGDNALAPLESRIRAFFHDAQLWYNDCEQCPFTGDAKLEDGHLHDLQSHLMRIGVCPTGSGVQDGQFSRSIVPGVVVSIARQRRRHPVQDYFESLQWDGDYRHISRLAGYVETSNGSIVYQTGKEIPYFCAVLYRFLVGAVARVYGDRDANGENFVMVLSGCQRSGKSSFASFLSPRYEWHRDGPVVVDNKDCRMAVASTLIWELQELGSVTKRQDVEAIKAFITQTHIKERAAYGRFVSDFPAICSYIGTINPDGGGFLRDHTGNRRFRVVDVTSIDFSYRTEIDIDQIWALAVHEYRENKKCFRLTEEEVLAFDAAAYHHETPDPLVFEIVSRTEVTGFDSDTLSVNEMRKVITDRLGAKTTLNLQNDYRSVGIAINRAFAQEISDGTIQKVRRQINGNRDTEYTGVYIKSQSDET